MKIKVCGMREQSNVRQVAQLPIDYMGFIFYDKSPRFVPTPIHPDIIKILSEKNILKVGVFVNELFDEVLSISSFNHLEVIQCHGEESPAYCNRLKNEGFTVIKTFHLDKDFNFLSLVNYHDACDFFLFDSLTKIYGGSGMRFDWNLLRNYDNQKPIILSGGIGPGDEPLIKQITGLNIHAIDINSRFEIEPAIKDEKKIKTFLFNMKNQ